MNITVRNLSSNHIGRCTERDLELLGDDWIRVDEAPQRKPMSQPTTEQELTKEELIELLKPYKLKGLHLYSLEKLQEVYESKK